MFIPTSSEFVALCRAQIALLTQGLGASSSVVYLTQDLVEGAETRLVPIVAYPETAVTHQTVQLPVLPMAAIAQLEQSPRLLRNAGVLPSTRDSRLERSPDSRDDQPDVMPERSDNRRKGAALVPQRQLVLPLLHDEVVLGVLVTERSDRTWNEWERSQIQRIVETLVNACMLDQRYQWLEQHQRQERLIQAQQHDILDNLLHQFRNSLTALQTFSKLILKRILPGDTNREIAASISREANRLRELSEQLELAAAGIEAEEEALPAMSLLPAARDEASPVGETVEHESPPLLPGASGLAGVPLALETVHLETVLEPLLASAGAMAQSVNRCLHAAIAPALPPILANAQALREVLNNLVENALKYTAPGGSVLVQAKPLSTVMVEIAVIDTGKGIPAADQEHLFERRFRGVQAQSDIPGSGLGLAIAQALVEQMHGKIQVFSPMRENDLDACLNNGFEKPTNHQGTTFAVQLPIATGNESGVP